jgi:hypothetical protein
MKQFLHFVCLFVVCSWLTGCVNASKDVYFKSRVPNMETIAINPKSKFGLNLSAETRRFQVRVTRDLVSSFRFYKDASLVELEKSDKKQPVSALDAEITFAEAFAHNWPFQVGVGFDHFEFKTNLFDARGGGATGWKGIVNTGIYKTTAFQTNGSGQCSFLCFSSDSDREKAKTSEDNINVDYKGYETKLGTSIGYYFAKNHAFYTGYNWMDGLYEASATQDNAPFGKIEMREAWYGNGFGLGYLYHVNEKFVLNFSGQKISMSWAGENHISHNLNVEGQVAF